MLFRSIRLCHANPWKLETKWPSAQPVAAESPSASPLLPSESGPLLGRLGGTLVGGPITWVRDRRQSHEAGLIRTSDGACSLDANVTQELLAP